MEVGARDFSKIRWSGAKKGEAAPGIGEIGFSWSLTHWFLLWNGDESKMTCVCLLGNWHVRCKDSWEDEFSFPIGEMCWFSGVWLIMTDIYLYNFIYIICTWLHWHVYEKILVTVHQLQQGRVFGRRIIAIEKGGSLSWWRWKLKTIREPGATGPGEFIHFRYPTMTKQKKSVKN